MGNNPSTPAGQHPSSSLSSSKPQTPVSAESATSPRTLRNPHRSPISIGHTSHALAPEPSTAFAHGQSVPTRAGFSHLQQHHHQYSQQQQQHHHHHHQAYSPSHVQGHSQSSQSVFNNAHRAAPVPIPDSRPVGVPQAAAAPGAAPHTIAVGAEFDATHIHRDDPLAADLGSAMLPNNSISDLSYLTRPPRLPLPIEEELKTPGSPIAGPTEVSQIIDDEGDILAGKPASVVDDAAAALGENAISRKTSDGTVEVADDDLADWGGGGDGMASAGPTLPTRIEWLGGGEKVWVTGTIFHWKKKHRLLPIEGRPGCFADTINVKIGTHHIRFLVDGHMETSKDMPTTVDLANNLVNYMVVEEPVQAEQDDSDDQEAAKRPKTRTVPAAKEYRHELPQYLADFDQPEESPAYHRALRAMEKLPPPPALPGFLAKPILNAPTVVREDNSVLILPPNHTVLNHLATCSIKNNILSVSATTRYKAKYVTTIVYKPSTMDE